MALFWPAPVNHTNGINAPEFKQIPQQKLEHSLRCGLQDDSHPLPRKPKTQTDHRGRQHRLQTAAFSVKVNHYTPYTRKSSENTANNHDCRGNLERNQGSTCSCTMQKVYLRFYLATTYFRSPALSALIKSLELERNVISKRNALCLPDTDWGWNVLQPQHCRNGWMCLREWVLACGSTVPKRGLQLLLGIGVSIYFCLRFMYYCLEPTPDLVSSPSLSPVRLKHSSFPYVDVATGT